MSDLRASPARRQPDLSPPVFHEVVVFFVPGIAKPGGSKTAKVIQRNGEVVRVNGRPLVTMRDDAKENAGWKQDVKFFARKEWRGDPLHGTLRVTFRFVMPRIGSHYGTGRNLGVLKPNAPVYHTVKPDLTKLIRSTEDACTGILWADDARIGEFGPGTAKVYGERPGVEITVEAMEELVPAPPRAALPLFATGGAQ